MKRSELERDSIDERQNVCKRIINTKVDVPCAHYDVDPDETRREPCN